MNAATVYSVTQALSKEEQIKLYKMLQADMCKVGAINNKPKNQPSLTNQEAINYLFKNVFNKN
jgi:hypothetical protein